MIQLLDIKIDVVFKDFFGDKTHKEVLESFINSVLDLEGDNAIEVEKFLDSRENHVGMFVKPKYGESYIVKIQSYTSEDFIEHPFFFLAKSYVNVVDHLRNLKKFGWVDLPKVHLIPIIDFYRTPSKDGIFSEERVTKTFGFQPISDRSNNHLFDQWETTLINLEKFEDKPFESLRKHKELWFFLLKNASVAKEKEIAALKKNHIFNMALERLKMISSDPNIREAYNDSTSNAENLKSN